MRRLRSVLALAALTVAAVGVPAPPAVAVPCDSHDRADSEGYNWVSGRRPSADAFPGIQAMDPYFDAIDAVYYYANEAMRMNCSFEDGDRELRYPAMIIGDLEVSATTFVPTGPPAFQRVLVLLRNPGSEPAALPPYLYGAPTYGAGNQVITSSNGDGEATVADEWLTLRDSGDMTKPRVAFLWSFGPAADRRRSANLVSSYRSLAEGIGAPFTGGDEQLAVRFDRHVVAPGETVAYLWAGLLRADEAGAEAAARQLQAAPEALLAGLSDDEKRALQNVGLPDRDLDGLPNAGDNCADAVNADQANLDGDATGDACDDDIDGDGVANLAETARGTDPRKGDTDGDGRRDDADVCPLKAGGGADGCVRGDDPPPVPDTTKPGATIRSLRATMKLKAFRRGVPCVVDVTEAATVLCRLLVRATRVARVAAAGDLEVAARSLPLATGRRSVRLKAKRGLIRQRRFRATLQVTVTDAAGNRTTKAKRFRVR